MVNNPKILFLKKKKTNMKLALARKSLEKQASKQVLWEC